MALQWGSVAAIFVLIALNGVVAEFEGDGECFQPVLIACLGVALSLLSSESYLPGRLPTWMALRPLLTYGGEARADQCSTTGCAGTYYGDNGWEGDFLAEALASQSRQSVIHDAARLYTGTLKAGRPLPRNGRQQQPSHLAS